MQTTHEVDAGRQAGSSRARHGEGVQTFREHYRREVIPPRYDGRSNIRNNLLLCALLTLSSAVCAGHWSTHTVAGFVIGALVFNWFEYAFHRWISHRKRAALASSYLRHTGHHHGFFKRDSMVSHVAEDVHVTVMPTATIAAYFVAYVVLLGPIVLFTLGGAATGSFAMAIALSLLQLDVLHHYYHLGPDSALSRVLDRFAYARYLKWAHAQHHDPAWMTRAGFNITHPLCDLLYGTLCRAENHGPEEPVLQ